MKLRHLLLSAVMALTSLTMLVAPTDADAKRLGGGRPAGMQRQMPAKQADRTPDNAPAGNNATQSPANNPGGAAAAGAAGAQAGKRSWMGPIAGIAAGLGIAALMSHLGMGEAFGNFLMMALLAMLAVLVIGWLMRRFGAGRAAAVPQLAAAGMGQRAFDAVQQPRATVQPMARTELGASGASGSFGAAQASGVGAGTVPAGFDAAGFERIAKMIFIRLQAANDAGNVDDLRKFTTPELFASLRLDMQERGGVAQQTDVLELAAQLVDTSQESDQWVATVRFSGLIREEADSGASPFKELWHLVKPVEGDREWAIAGITPLGD